MDKENTIHGIKRPYKPYDVESFCLF